MRKPKPLKFCVVHSAGIRCSDGKHRHGPRRVSHLTTPDMGITLDNMTIGTNLARRAAPFAAALAFMWAVDSVAAIPMTPPGTLLTDAIATAATGAGGTWLRDCTLRTTNMPFGSASTAVDFAFLAGTTPDPSGRQVGVFLGRRGDEYADAVSPSVTFDQRSLDPFAAEAAGRFERDAAYRFEGLRLLPPGDAARLILPEAATGGDALALADSIAGICPGGLFVPGGAFELVRDRSERIVTLVVATADGGFPAIEASFPEGMSVQYANGRCEARSRGPVCFELVVTAPGYRKLAAQVVLLAEHSVDLEADLGAYWSGEPPARLMVAMDPDSPTASAELTFRGRSLGQTPLRLELRERVYGEILSLSANGIAVDRAIDIDGPGTRALPFFLDAEPRTLRLSSSPSGASVWLNGQPVGSTPLDLGWYGPAVRVRLEAVGMMTWESEIVLPPGAAEERLVSLQVQRQGDGLSSSFGLGAYGLQDARRGLRYAGGGIGAYTAMITGSPPFENLVISGGVFGGAVLDMETGDPLGFGLDVQTCGAFSAFGNGPFDIFLQYLVIRYGIEWLPDFSFVCSLGSGLGLKLSIGGFTAVASGQYHWAGWPSTGMWSVLCVAGWKVR